ncbi:MAG: response regulator transcription factor [Roseburia sp.]|nr:response regulator transcription factor [Roseburia sp.]MCM1098286.1 response regulator transcription factor [Ruminococcus flavefaciens]
MITKGHIFVAEDEQVIRQELKVLLENALYQVTAPESFEQLVPQIKKAEPDLVLLDVNLPGASGFDVCVRLRQEREVPVIFLTGRTSPMDELNGLLKGGDDYIVKPYQAPLLLARVAAVLKRAGGQKEKETTLYTRDGVQLDVARCSLFYCGRTADLTKNEMKILHLLLSHAGEYVSRMDLIEYLWENRIFIDDNTLSVHIAKLREKLKAIGAENFIETKRGIGYRV